MKIFIQVIPFFEFAPKIIPFFASQVNKQTSLKDGGLGK